MKSAATIPKILIVRSRPMILMRHGRTDWNRRGLVMGTKDMPLDASELRQAHSCAQELAGLGIDIIYSSPLQRCLQTSQIVSEHLGLEILVVSELAERDWGIYQGRPTTERMANQNPPNGESAFDFQRRIAVTFASTVGGALPLVVTHSGVIRLVLSNQFPAESKIPNAKPIFSSYRLLPV